MENDSSEVKDVISPPFAKPSFINNGFESFSKSNISKKNPLILESPLKKISNFCFSPLVKFQLENVNTSKFSRRSSLNENSSKEKTKEFFWKKELKQGILN